MGNFAQTFEEIKPVGFSGGFAIFRVRVGSGFGFFFRVRVGFGLVKKPRVGSGFRVFGYPTHHYVLVVIIVVCSVK